MSESLSAARAGADPTASLIDDDVRNALIWLASMVLERESHAKDAQVLLDYCAKLERARRPNEPSEYACACGYMANPPLCLHCGRVAPAARAEPGAAERERKRIVTCPSCGSLPWRARFDARDNGKPEFYCREHGWFGSDPFPRPEPSDAAFHDIDVDGELRSLGFSEEPT